MPDASKNMDDLFNLCASFPEDTEKKTFFDAARNNNITALEKIIDKWPEAPNKWYEDGKPVLLKHYDAIKPETLAFLLGKGADINQTDTKGNWTPLIMAGFLGTEKDVEKFIRAGAPVDHKDKAGRTALSMAVEHGKCLPAIDMLVICGADPEHKSTWGKTIMEEAKTDEIRDIIKNAQARREAFLKGERLKPAAPAAIQPYTPPSEDSDEIKLLKRIELRKVCDTPTPKKPESPLPAKKPWWKFGS